MAAVERLNQILPLAQNLRSLDVSMLNLHKAILNSYVSLGRSLTRDEMAQQTDDVNTAIATFKQNDLVVFNKNNEPVGAYPFTMEEREHRVTINGHTVHCMCALDALAVSPMFDLATQIHSRCHVTFETVFIQQYGTTVNKEAQSIYFGINWSAASADSCCADSLCTEMVFLKDKAVAENWFNESPEHRGIFTLDEAIDFASRFFLPIIEHP